MSVRRMELLLDDLDFDAIQGEITRRQVQRRGLPDGESNLSGAIVAEIVRDLIEYRELWNSEHRP